MPIFSCSKPYLQSLKRTRAHPSLSSISTALGSKLSQSTKGRDRRLVCTPAICRTLFAELRTGWGLYLARISKQVTRQDDFEVFRRVCDLGPYDHLRRILRLCVTHFRRNIKKLGDKGLSAEVLQMMHSLASAQVLQDYAQRIEAIQAGGDLANSKPKRTSAFSYSNKSAGRLAPR